MTSICVSLTEKTTDSLLARMAELEKGVDLFEIRGDFVQDLDLLKLIRLRSKPILFTCRAASEGGHFTEGEEKRRRILLEAMRRGFDFVDVEHKSSFLDIMLEKTGHGLVVSFHDFEKTPQDLRTLYEDMRGQGADVVKLAFVPKTMEDVGRLVRLSADVFREGATPVVGIAMGPMGLVTRLTGGRYGAPFTFASSHAGKEAGPGQLTHKEMAERYRVGKVGPETKVYGVVGSSVVRSLSPVLHNRAFEVAGLDAIYVPLETPDLAPFMKALPDLELAGFSVTRPFKTEILSYLAELDATAAECGSVNTVLVRGGNLLGTSSDGFGVVGPLRKRCPLRGAEALVLGAGGAARAAARALVVKGARTTILARNLKRAHEVATGVGCQSDALSTLPDRDWDVLVNATPVGGRETPNETLVPRVLLGKGRVVFEMVYDPLETRLLREAREAGCEAVDGLEMLVAQAAAQFEGWTGREAPVEEMRKAAFAALEVKE
jgi:3-dehydroquinate dehydratase/shikimate dehydrogenase